jgi:hypothetical protein
MGKRVKFFLVSLFLYGSALLGAEPNYVHYADAISSRIIKQIEKEFDVHCDATGGSMPHDVASIYLSFATQRRVSLEEARIMHVRCTEMLKEAVNADERVRPFLAEYPFPPSRSEISLSFSGPVGSWNHDGTINHIFGARGKIFYFISDPIDVKIDSFHEEPYEDALKIVKQSTLTNR